MESIERLREYAGLWDGRKQADVRSLTANLCTLADAIERELAERYVELPLDADGVPIHVGDEVTFTNSKGSFTRAVEAISETWVVFGDATFYSVRSCRHHQPDTWERIIEDACNIHGSGFNPCWDEARDALVARCRALAGEVGE